MKRRADDIVGSSARARADRCPLQNFAEMAGRSSDRKQRNDPLVAMIRDLSSASFRRTSFFAAGAAFVLGGWACGTSNPGSSGSTAGAVGISGAGNGVSGSASGGASSSGASGVTAGAPAAGASSAGASVGGNAAAGSAGAATTTAGSGGSAGAAGGGSAGTGGMAACVTAGTELCENFESGMLDAQRWTQAKATGSSITVETGKAHTGQYSVHLKFVANQQSTVTINEGVTFPAGNPNKFYSRMWVWFAPDIPKAASGDFHTGFMIGGGKNDTGDVTAGMGMIGTDQQYLGYSIFFGDATHPKLEFGPWSVPRIVPNTWLCIEMLEDGSDPTTEKRQVWLNDVEMKELASDSAKSSGGNANHLPPKFDKVSYGVTEYHPIPTLTDMWIDDIRVSSNKIGCAN